MSEQEQGQEVHECEILRVSSSDIAGQSIRLKVVNAERFTSSNAAGNLREVNGPTDVTKLGKTAAERLICVFSQQIL